MNIEYRDVVIIGGGPAGLSAAISAKESGAESVVIIEREQELGGILNQCIHPGFGLVYFKEELTGPEYAARFINRLPELDIEYRLGTTVIDLDQERNVTIVNPETGLSVIKAGAVILAMGCRERSRGALNIPGSRPAGVYTAGTAQRMINREGYLPGKEIVILGSGDVGLIMARRCSLEGAKVKLVAEVLPQPSGLERNIVQCLEDFDIPLLLSHTVTQIHGHDRITGVSIAQVDEKMKQIQGTEKFYSCDTLLISCGLIPENEISRAAGIEIDQVAKGPIVNAQFETNIPGIFACGNALHVLDLADTVSAEAEKVGRNAALSVTQSKEI